jgi:hypothetical protein
MALYYLLLLLALQSLVALSLFSILEVSHQNIFFVELGCLPHVQPPTWRTRVYLFAWVITFDLSGMGSPTISYATVSVALRIN